MLVIVWGTGKHLLNAGVGVNWLSLYGITVEVSQKPEDKTAIWPSSDSPGFIHKRLYILPQILVHPYLLLFYLQMQINELINKINLDVRQQMDG